MKIKFKDSVIGLTLLIIFTVFYTINEKYHDTKNEAHAYLTIFIFFVLLWTIYSLEQHYGLNKKWKHFSRDIIIVLTISIISTELLRFYQKEFSLTYLCISILFFALSGKIYAQYKTNKLYEKRKKDLSIYNDKLKEYINIPLAKGDNLKRFWTDYGALIIESTNIEEDNNPIISELNYFESNFELRERAIKNKHDPSIVIVIDWIHGNSFKAKITFIDYEAQETNGTIIMDFSHLKKGYGFDYPGAAWLKGYKFDYPFTAWLKEVKEEILYLLNNFDDVYKINFVDSYSDVPKLVTEYFQNGNISCTGYYDSYNFRIGEWKYFYENGIMRECCEYKEGRKTRKWVKYFEDGKPFIENSANGKKEFWENGNLKIDLMNDNSGNLLHKKEFWENGNIKLEINDNDEKMLYKEYDIDGNLITEKEHYKSNFPF